MQKSTFSAMLSTLLALALLSSLAAAHSWVEEYQIISDNGSFTGPRGYSRGYVSRTDPTYNGFSMMWMLPSLEARNADGTVRTRIDETDSVCHPAQRTSNYTAIFPKLQVSPGDYVAIKYLENGHVSLPWNITGKPPGGGSVFVFGTTKPSDDEKIADVMQWTRDGKGGNANGFLMTTQNFDDGRCHQLNCGSISQERQILQPNHIDGQPTSTVESWCENDVQIPESVSAGTLTTYWIWQFGTEANADCNTPAGKDEYYTSCADFDVVGSTQRNKLAAPAAAAPEAAQGQSNPQRLAVSDYKSRAASVTAPSYIFASNNTKNKRSDSDPVNPSFVSSCSVQASVISANNLNLWPEVYVPNSCGVISSFGTAAASTWSQTWGVEASRYTAGAESAWKVAFEGAGMKVPVRTTVDTAAGTTASASASASVSAPGYSSAAPTAEAGFTTMVTVVTLTSTLPVNQPSSTSIMPESSSPPVYSEAASYSAAPASSSSTTTAVSAPTYSELPLSVSGSAPAYSELSSSSYPTTSSTPEATETEAEIIFPTISTVSAPASYSEPTPASLDTTPTLSILSIPTSASSLPSALAYTSSSAAVPSVAPNGTIQYRRRLHARNFSGGWRR